MRNQPKRKLPADGLYFVKRPGHAGLYKMHVEGNSATYHDGYGTWAYRTDQLLADGSKFKLIVAAK